jgi:hypothetical protein
MCLLLRPRRLCSNLVLNPTTSFFPDSPHLRSSVLPSPCSILPVPSSSNVMCNWPRSGQQPRGDTSNNSVMCDLSRPLLSQHPTNFRFPFTVHPPSSCVAMISLRHKHMATVVGTNINVTSIRTLVTTCSVWQCLDTSGRWPIIVGSRPDCIDTTSILTRHHQPTYRQNILRGPGKASREKNMISKYMVHE